MRLIGLLTAFMAAPLIASAQLMAPGQPGATGTWSHPEKQAYGTSFNRPVWFTLSSGVLSEVTYPTVELVQTRDSFLVLRDLSGKVVDERKHCRHDVRRLPQSLIYEVKSTCPGFLIRKRFVATPSFDGIEIDYAIEFDQAQPRQLLFVHNPTGSATAGGDGLQVMKDPQGEPILVGGQVDIRGDEPASVHVNAVQVVTWTLPKSTATVGFEGISSPLDLLSANKELPLYSQALYGNVAGALVHRTESKSLKFQVVIAFSENRIQNYSHVRPKLLAKSGDSAALHVRGWAGYLSRLRYDSSDRLSESSILVLKALEDRANPGALIAGPANPAIPWLEEAHEQHYEDSRVRRGDSNSGYRRVWPRDLYHKALAFLAVNDYETAINTLRWFRKTQLRDGTWSQNMWVDGTPSWQAFQIDETALPIALVWRLVEAGKVSYPEYRSMVRSAAVAVAKRGPGTGQERWEENGGLSPNSFAAAVEGLLAASRLESLSGGDPRLAEAFKRTADEWTSNLKTWLVIPQGAYGSNYIARLELGRNGKWDPTSHDQITIANKSNSQRKVFREDEILDGGFIEWIIAGLIDPHDPVFTNTLRIYDRNVRKKTRAGVGYLRYTEDAFGKNNFGGAWPLLSAERALAAIERGDLGEVQGHLNFIRGLATPAEMICEQDTISTCPLGWSHGAYLILRRSIAEGRSFYIPRSILKRR